MSRRGWTALGAVLIMTVTVIAACADKAAKTGSTSHPASTRQAAATSQTASPMASAQPVRPSTGAPANPSAGDLNHYTNARFGFSFDVPVGFTAQALPEDGDGLSFTNAARTVTITAYGDNNTLARSPAQELTAVTATYQSAGDTITYRFAHGDVIALSGTTPHGAIFYHREVVYPAVIYALLWTYPTAARFQYDPLVTATVHSFVPGPAHSS